MRDNLTKKTMALAQPFPVPLTKGAIRDMRSTFQDELTMLGEKYGVTINLGSARYGRATVTFRMEIAVPDESGTTLTKEQEALNLYGQSLFGHPVKVGYRFTWGVDYTIEGYTPRRHKYPITVKRVSDGKMFKMTVAQIKSALGHLKSYEHANVA